MKRFVMIAGVVFLAYLAASIIPVQAAYAAEGREARDIVVKSQITFEDFMADKNFTWFQENIRKAKAVLLFPQVLKGGFFWGGSGGTGVLVVKDEKTGEWSQPAFYTIGSVTFGLQIGAEAAEVVMLAMSQKAVDSLYASSLKLGGDIAVAAGPYGAGIKKIVTADFISFAKAKGLYAGLSFEGSGIAVRDKLNKAYYGREVSPVGIILKHEVSNPGSTELLEALKKRIH